MAAGQGGEKTEKATPKKLKDARKKGQLFQSRDIVTAITILILFMTFQMTIPDMIERMARNMESFLGVYTLTTYITPEYGAEIIRFITIEMAMIMWPIMLISVILGIVLHGVQTRFNFTPSLLKFKPERINPLEGLKKMISIRSLVELVKTIAKVTLVVYVMYSSISGKIGEMSRLYDMPISAAAAWIGDEILSLAYQIGGVMLAIGAADFFYQWWDYQKNMMMSKQEVKDEYKQMEGDPQIKAKIKERQRRIATMRMMQRVPTADVVVRNPTHYAVAIKYDVDKDPAPLVIAKGSDYLALRIIKLAEENGVEVVENKPLARALYEAVEIDRFVPYEFYIAMAEILAFVYKKQNRGSEKR